MFRWIALASVFAIVVASTACSQPIDVDIAASSTASTEGTLLSDQDAIDLVINRVRSSEPEVDALEEPRNPTAWRTTWGEYQDREGGGRDYRDGEIPVWVVQVEGLWRSAGITPPEARREFRYAVGVVDARDGSIFSGSRSNEPLVWPVATDAQTMSNPERVRGDFVVDQR